MREFFSGASGESGKDANVEDLVDTEELHGLGEEGVTLSHVYQKTAILIGEIEILRTAMGVEDAASAAERRFGQTVFHAYVKSLEVLGKIRGFQRRVGMEPTNHGEVRMRNIGVQDLDGSIVAAIEELRRAKRQLVVEQPAAVPAFAGGKTSSLVSANLERASALMDGLVGRTATLKDIGAVIVRVKDELRLVAPALGTRFTVGLPVVQGEKTATEVGQQVLRATAKVIELQSRLGMIPSTAPGMVLTEAELTHILNGSTVLLTEVLRVKEYLDIASSTGERQVPWDEDTTGLFTQLLLILRNLDRMLRLAAETE